MLILTNQRSILYNVEPVGIDTGLVESLSSYLIRVAYEHNITVGHLINKIVIPNMHKDYLQRSTIYGGNSFYDRAKTINGFMDNSKELVRIMEILTSRRDLTNLTLFKFQEFIPLRKLLKDSLSWCPGCIMDWHITGEIIYYPLIWYLKPVGVCIKHNRYLSEKCPNCDEKVHVLRRQMIPGYCTNCSSFLGQDILEKEPSSQELYWYTFINRNILGLIECNNNQLSIKDAKYGFHKQLDILNQELFLGNISNFSKTIGIPKNTLRSWLKGENLPVLDSLLLICFKLKINVLDLLLEKEKLKVDIHQIYNQTKIDKKKSTGKPLDLDSIERVLKEFLECGEPISMTAAAKKIGRDKRVLYRNFPDCCKQISERYREFIKQNASNRIELLKKEIDLVFHLLISEGVYPSSGQIERRVNKKGLLREKVLQDYWKNLLMENEFC